MEVDLSNKVGKKYYLKRGDDFLATVRIDKGGFMTLLAGSHIRKAEAPGMKTYRKSSQNTRANLKAKGAIIESEPYDIAAKDIPFTVVSVLAGVVGGSSRSGDSWLDDDGNPLTN